jgi:ribosome biogenesis protein Tsr3
LNGERLEKYSTARNSAEVVVLQKTFM